MTQQLWHYTCEHAADKIGERGVLLPGAELNKDLPEWLWWANYVWLTDLPAANRGALGLTSYAIECDRTEYRYRVLDARHVRSWISIRRTLSHPEDVEDATLDGRPAHWYVSTHPVPVVLDQPEDGWTVRPDVR
jgi:hypothetical protein